MIGATSLLPTATMPSDLLDSTNSSSPSRSIEDTAKQFESLFLSMILKEMRQTLEPESLFAGDTGDVQGGLFDLYMGKSLADAGGVGLGNMLIRQLQPSAAPHEATTEFDVRPAAPPRSS